MQITVKFLRGRHKLQSLKGKTYNLVVPWNSGALGGYVIVSSNDDIKGIPITVKCNYDDIEYYDQFGKRIDIPPNGEIKDFALYTVEETLSAVTREAEAERGSQVSKYPENLSYRFVRGVTSTIGLYQILWDNRMPNQVTIFDDSDNILFEENSLNLLKHALDSSKLRILSWQKESKVLQSANIDKEFEFRGSIIFLTNVKFENVVGRLALHIEALLSRCHYLDLDLKTDRDKMARINLLVNEGMLNRYGFTHSQQSELMRFVREYQTQFRELSPRMVSKLADLMKADTHTWERKAKLTCLKT